MITSHHGQSPKVSAWGVHGGSRFDIVINNTGREIHLIQVNSGNVISGVAKKL